MIKLKFQNGVLVSRNLEQTKPEEWPLWAKAIRLKSIPEDKGVGDTVRRVIGEENSEAFKKWFKLITGKDCGCSGRQASWNRIYSYAH